MYDKKRLVALIRQQAVKLGQHKLASGQVSEYYIDLSKVAMTGEGLNLMCWGILSLWRTYEEWDFDSIGGPVLGAVPIVSGISVILNHLGMTPNRTFMVRKEAKEHGNPDLVEGQLQAGDKVLMIEDVVTSGKSVYDACMAVEAHGATVKHVVALVDRKAGGEEFLRSKGYGFTSLLSVFDILEPVAESASHYSRAAL